MKILITNSVPLNGGDEALLRATYLSLKKEFKNAKITVLCSNLPLCKEYIHDIDLDWDLEFVRNKKEHPNRYFRKIRRLLHRHTFVKEHDFISLLFADKVERRLINLYKHADVIISSPGGFIHDFYPIKQRLAGFEFALMLKKPLIIFAQSVGPFWLPESISQIKAKFEKLAAIILREEISGVYLRNCNLSLKNVTVTADAAFLWRKLNPELFVKKNGTLNAVAMCFRSWPVVDSRIDEIIQKASQLCLHLLMTTNIRIGFLSTCQGIKNYVNDSAHAFEIIKRLPADLQSRCFVDERKYGPIDLIKAYSKYDAFIGMRLHGAILAMLGGTPAMGIAYEDKTAGIFSAMDLDDYHTHYENSASEWISRADHFLADISTLQSNLSNSLDIMADKSFKSLSIVKSVLGNYEH